MGTEGRHTGHDSQAEPVCPACGRSVGTVARRHKVLGAWVPLWEARPCPYSDCSLFGRKADGSLPPEAEREDADGAGRPQGAGTPSGRRGPGDDDDGPGGTEATTTQVTGKNGETGRSPAPG
ncbi:hypothetical protein [Streptomyces sp. NPDC053755]|uniref:hypothetical protein n=1 Tax=Streptomyces sp. NPDC053755 TaxID=3155815 RepID=UPI0034300879